MAKRAQRRRAIAAATFEESRTIETGRAVVAGQSAPQGRSRSRPYQRARQDRGAETRAQLIEAALDVFGLLGFQGATTREIAKAAGANLAAIAYHFGSKEALHIAVAEHVAKRMRAALEPALADIAAPTAAASPAAARESFGRLIGAYVDLLVGSAEAERWARFIVREQMQPSAAFDTIYGFMRAPVSLAMRLVAVATGRPEDEETRLRVFAMFGQVLVFRVSQALVTRHMGWTAIGERERAEIKRIVAGHVAAILTGVAER
jgi:TetR/AcrR family transcriptional regulator, regulator of cefoperazone and chloramphenicol sensitivity